MKARDEPRDEGTASHLAPAWHTALLVGVMLAVAITGMLIGHYANGGGAAAAPRSRIVPVYLPMIAVQGMLVLYVCRVGRPASALRALIGQGMTSIGRAAGDVALAALAWLAIEGLELCSARLLGVRHNASVGSLLPQTIDERLVWIVVAGSVGFTEELVYRGYLQTQLTAFTRRPLLGVLGQAVLFGLAHGEQGLAAAARFALYGALFGLLARWRGSLVPGMLCHVMVDLVSGLVHRG